MPATTPTVIAMPASPGGPNADAASRPTAFSRSVSGSGAITRGSIGWAMPATTPNPRMQITKTVQKITDSSSAWALVWPAV